MKLYIIGMGALGVMYADHIKEHGGDVAFVMDRERLARYEGRPVICNGREQTFAMVDAAKADPADLVITAVKYSGLKPAIQTMRRCVDGCHEGRKCAQVHTDGRTVHRQEGAGPKV